MFGQNILFNLCKFDYENLTQNVTTQFSIIKKIYISISNSEQNKKKDSQHDTDNSTGFNSEI